MPTTVLRGIRQVWSRPSSSDTRITTGSCWRAAPRPPVRSTWVMELVPGVLIERLVSNQAGASVVDDADLQSQHVETFAGIHARPGSAHAAAAVQLGEFDRMINAGVARDEPLVPGDPGLDQQGQLAGEQVGVGAG